MATITINGMEVVDGQTYRHVPPWLIYKSPQILLQCGVPIGISPTGTMAANGAVTLGTALNATYDGGLWLYYPAGAVFAGSEAGFYWTVMSSTTLGTVYSNTYTPGSTPFDIPASPTAVSAAGPGAYTGYVGTLTAHSFTLPGNLLGPHGTILTDFISTNNSSGNSKGCYVQLDGNTIAGVSSMTTNVYHRALARLSNAGRIDRQRGTIWHYTGATSSYAGTSSSKNTATDLAMIVVVNNNTAGTDYSLCESVAIQVLPS